MGGWNGLSCRYAARGKVPFVGLICGVYIISWPILFWKRPQTVKPIRQRAPRKISEAALSEDVARYPDSDRLRAGKTT